MISLNKIKIRISIATKGKGTVANIEREYTMAEHFDDKYIRDAEVFAKSEMGLEKTEIVVQDWPIIDKALESEIERLYGSAGKVVEGKMAIPNVHNPMHSCFKSYREIPIMGQTVLIKPVSAGVVYAVPNQKWIEELKKS